MEEIFSLTPTGNEKGVSQVGPSDPRYVPKESPDQAISDERFSLTPSAAAAKPPPRIDYNAALAENERKYRANRQSLPGYLTSIASFGDVMGGIAPYLAAAPKMLTNDKTYAQNVGDAKRILQNSQEAHPEYYYGGTGAGIVASLPLGGATTLAKSLGLGGTFGLTQGGTGLEDLISGKGGIVDPALQAAIGAAYSLPAHYIGQKINPTAIKDATKYARELGVSLPAGIMNAGQKGYGHLADAASETATGISKMFQDLTAPISRLSTVQTAKNAINEYAKYAGRNLPPSLAKTVNDPHLAFNNIINLGADGLDDMRETLLRNGGDVAWENLQNGFIRHLAGKGKFSFGDFSKRLGEIPEETTEAILRGYDKGNKLLGDVSNLGRSTMREGVNLIDAAAHGVAVAQKKSSKAYNYVKGAIENPLNQAIAYANFPLGMTLAAKASAAIPLLVAGYGVKKGAQATGKALDKRNVASPTLSKIVNNAALAGERYVTSKAGDVVEGITSYTQPAIKAAVNTAGGDKASKWWSKNMPAILGGKAEGGRIAYKKGGAVHSNVEPLVQDLMKRYKAVKKSQDNGTKPLLEQPDQAIVKALEVAQKAI